jgi:hypothetical protein
VGARTKCESSKPLASWEGDFDQRQNGVLPGTTAGVVELSGSVIESPQGLHSNTYKSSVKARLIVWKIIGLPQTGQATSLLGLNSSLIGALCTQWWGAALTPINTSAKGPLRCRSRRRTIHPVELMLATPAAQKAATPPTVADAAVVGFIGPVEAQDR